MGYIVEHMRLLDEIEASTKFAISLRNDWPVGFTTSSCFGPTSAFAGDSHFQNAHPPLLPGGDHPAEITSGDHPAVIRKLHRNVSADVLSTRDRRER